MNNQFPSAPTLQEDDTKLGRKQKGTGFTNISRILGANVGAGEQMGAQIGANIGSRAKSLREQTQAGAAKFRQGYTAGKEKALGEVGKVGGVVGQVDPTGYVAPAPVTPTPAAQTAAAPNMQVAPVTPTPAAQTAPVPSTIGDITGEQAEKLGEGFRAAEYTGPMGISGAGDLSGVAKSLADTSGYAARGMSGRQNLLRSIASGQYTKGQSLLDAALLGQSKAGQEAIARGAQEARQASTETGQQLNLAQKLAETAEEQISGEKKKIGDALTEKISAIKGSGKEAAKGFSDQIKRVQSILNGGEQIISESDAASSPDKAKKRAEQQEILKNLSNYGIDTSGIVYSIDENAVQNLLNSLIATPEIPAEGALKFTESQKRALESLSKIKGENDYKKLLESEFKTPWNINKQNIEESELTTKNKNLYESLQSQGSKIKNYIKMIKEYMATPDDKKPYYEGIGKNADPFSFFAQKLGLDPNQMQDLWRKSATGQRGSGGFEGMNREADRLLGEAQRIQSTKMTLQDYINKKFGIK